MLFSFGVFGSSLFAYVAALAPPVTHSAVVPVELHLLRPLTGPPGGLVCGLLVPAHGGLHAALSPVLPLLEIFPGETCYQVEPHL